MRAAMCGDVDDMYMVVHGDFRDRMSKGKVNSVSFCIVLDFYYPNNICIPFVNEENTWVIIENREN